MKIKQTLVIIQSRFNSSRLPGKAIFPINGFPLVALAAKRAGNTGKEVVIATSDQSTDDEIALCAERYGIKCVRGSLDDTLARFATAVEGYEEDAIVFRLTADNIVPDGKMLDEMEAQYLRSGAEYMICDNVKSNVPYGVSAEVMRVKHIKDAHANSTSEFEREHVTPYIRNKYPTTVYHPFNCIGLSNFRCTIDTFDDYISLKNIFKKGEDIINIPAVELIGRFNKLLYKPNYEQAEKPMVLGGVQFGLDYGITNKNGKASQPEINEIIKQAITEGINYIDTASAYGDSEKSIGISLRGGWAERIKVITKTPPFSEFKDSTDPQTLTYATRSSVYRSCVNLSSNKLNVVMLHRASHLTEWQGSVFKELLSLKNTGVIEALGVSVQNPEELELALRFTDIKYIQLPFNILDYRWDSAIQLVLSEKKERDLVIHARSSLLQGLLQCKEQEIWKKACVDNPEPIMEWLESIRKKCSKMSLSDLCIGYVNSQHWIDAVVVGVENMGQLLKNTQSISMPFLNEDELILIDKTRPKVSLDTLNPAAWSVK
ncbi:aldo/keto reductase [Enterobacter cloacae]|uniref:aldo/keto reductase n=1 Tax=Enterobacter cloacae TaxID=550 RepID=UPI000F823FFF|nr:aldo/keto reductase [Enterobacter cloacae]MCJ8538507.1 aldo/keto reductase [Enterobacter cloacae]MCQ4409433.1 aldo/keto reductase [Enterobacter cloacae]MDV0879178.1 aldo/keto reductase [Enterobacter cloacae]MDV0894126.1 aldo/keto reductase [Enterobacter cloacae]MDV0966253.1 aldo/keto reductase [Enterobacter cloacae]